MQIKKVLKSKMIAALIGITTKSMQKVLNFRFMSTLLIKHHKSKSHQNLRLHNTKGRAVQGSYKMKHTGVAGHILPEKAGWLKQYKTD